MVLTVDIGNTNIVLGVFDQDELVFTARVSTDKNRTSDEYSVMIHGIFEINGFDLSRFDGIILSSVVPQLNSVVAYALGRFTSVRIRTVGPGLRTGFRILADDPTELGSDMVCNVAGALSEFEGPLTIVDFGTATTFTVVNAQSDICGVIIAPGMRISAEALTRRHPPSFRPSRWTARSRCSGATLWNACGRALWAAQRRWWTACWPGSKRNWVHR